MIAAGCPPMQGLQSAIDAFAAGVRFARLKKKILADGAAAELPDVGPAPATTRLLSEWEAKQALAKHGLTVPTAALATPVDAVNAATSIGFPVVAKLAKPVLAHKTEAGAVALNIGDGAALMAAIVRMTKSVAAYKPGLVAEQFLIERQMTGAVAELIIGVKRDDLFGLVLVIGAGGILVEMVEDAATLLLPVTRAMPWPRRCRACAWPSCCAAIAAGRPAISTRSLMPSWQSPPSPRRTGPSWWNSMSTRCWSCPRARAPSPSMRWW